MFDVLGIVAGGVVDCEDELTATERGAQERCAGARAMAGGNIRATAVPGLGSLGKVSAKVEREGGARPRGRGRTCVWRPRNALCVKEEKEEKELLALSCHWSTYECRLHLASEQLESLLWRIARLSCRVQLTLLHSPQRHGYSGQQALGAMYAVVRTLYPMRPWTSMIDLEGLLS